MHVRRDAINNLTWISIKIKADGVFEILSAKHDLALEETGERARAFSSIQLILVYHSSIDAPIVRACVYLSYIYLSHTFIIVMHFSDLKEFQN